MNRLDVLSDAERTARRDSLRLVVGEKTGRRIVRDSPDPSKILAAAVTDAGKKGKNEDAFVVGKGIGAVIDAMGGGEHGQDAARVVAGKIYDDFNLPEEGFLIRAARRAALAMKQEAPKYSFDPDRDGAVVSMARDHGSHIEGLIVGDAGLYVIDLTDRKIAERAKGQSTTDDFLATLDAGDIDEALKYLINVPGAKLDDLVLDGGEAVRLVTHLTGLRARNESIPLPFVDRVRAGISRKVKQSFVRSSIGPNGIDIPPIPVNFPKVAGHRYLVLLCSDGVTKCLTDHELLQSCLKASDPNAAVIEINRVVQERQGNPEYPPPDHATVLVFLA